LLPGGGTAGKSKGGGRERRALCNQGKWGQNSCSIWFNSSCVCGCGVQRMAVSDAAGSASKTQR
jgi:hypothetical protein